MRHPLLVLLAVALLFSCFGLMWGLPNLFDFAQDSVVPYGTLAQGGYDFERITSFRYPPFHFYVLRAAFLPARAFLTIPAFGQNPKLSATLFILSARLVSVVVALGTVCFLYATGRRLFGSAAAFAGALLFIASPVAAYYAKNANLDMPYAFWLSAALLLYVRLIERPTMRDFLLLGLAGALAVCTKDQAYGFLLLMPVGLFLAADGDTRRTMLRSWFPAAAAVFMVAFALVHGIFFRPSAFVQHFRTILGPASQDWREFSPGPLGQARLLVETILRLMDAWTPAGPILAGIGLAAAFRTEHRRRIVALLLPAVSYYVSFIAIVGYVYPRFCLPLMLVLSVLAGRGVMLLWNAARRRLGRGVAVPLIGWVALGGLSVDYVMANYSRYDAQMWLERNVPAGARVFYMGDMRDMPRFNKPVEAYPCEPSHEALARNRPDVLVLSFEHGHPATRSRSLRLSSLIRRRLGDWGRIGGARGAKSGGFYDNLVSGRLGYRVAARFESPIAAFVPDVAESLNRSIIILVRSQPWRENPPKG